MNQGRRVIWCFGPPGSGKDYVARRLAHSLGGLSLDCDDFLTESQRIRLKQGTFSAEDRAAKFELITTNVESLLNLDPNRAIIIADSLPTHESRLNVSQAMSPTFILIKVDPDKQRERIAKRTGHFFTADLLDDWLSKHWQEPIQIPHFVFDNNSDEGDTFERNITELLTQLVY